MRKGGRSAAVLFFGSLALALLVGAGPAFAHRDCGPRGDCDCRGGKAGCGDRRGPGDCGPCGSHGAPGAGCEAAPCPDCGKAPGKVAGPAAMEGMKSHAADVRRRLEALRKSEKALAGITDPAAFRAAVLEHLKAVGDLEEAHLRHLESMPGRMTAAGKAGGAGPCPEGCREGGAAPAPPAR